MTWNIRSYHSSSRVEQPFPSISGVPKLESNPNMTKIHGSSWFLKVTTNPQNPPILGGHWGRMKAMNTAVDNRIYRSLYKTNQFHSMVGTSGTVSLSDPDSVSTNQAVETAWRFNINGTPELRLKSCWAARGCCSVSGWRSPT